MVEHNNHYDTPDARILRITDVGPPMSVLMKEIKDVAQECGPSVYETLGIDATGDIRLRLLALFFRFRGQKAKEGMTKTQLQEIEHEFVAQLRADIAGARTIGGAEMS